MLRVSKCCPSHNFHPISIKLFYGKYHNRGEYRVLLFWRYGTLKISHLSYIAISRKPILVSSGKRSNRASQHLGLLFVLSFLFRTKRSAYTCTYIIGEMTNIHTLHSLQVPVTVRGLFAFFQTFFVAGTTKRLLSTCRHLPCRKRPCAKRKKLS